MVRQQNRLRMLHMGIARKNSSHIIACCIYKRTTERIHILHKIFSKHLSVQARISNYLVITRAAGMKTSTSVTDILSKNFFDRHMDIFIVDIKGKRTLVDRFFNIRKSSNNNIGIFLGNYPLSCQHACMSTRASNILMIHCLIYWQRSTKFLCKFAYTFFKSSRPQCHVLKPFSKLIT